MTNRIQEFLETKDASTVRDIATHGVQSGAIGELIYTADVVNFFDRYYSDIETVVTDYLEGITGDKYFNLLDYELMRDLEDYTGENVQFQSEDSYLELQFDLAENIASEYADFDEADEDEQQELIIEALDYVEMDIQDTDKVEFVNLAVEMVAQELAGESGDI